MVIFLGDDQVQDDCDDAADREAVAEHQDESVPAASQAVRWVLRTLTAHQADLQRMQACRHGRHQC